MWELKDPNPVKLIVGILAADEQCLPSAHGALAAQFGPTDLQSDIWPFDQTDYYKKQTGNSIIRQFLSFEKLIDPGVLAEIKLATNRIEQDLAQAFDLTLPRPVNLDPGLIEPSKLVLATTKNYSHRIYIGKRMFAEVTLTFDKGKWKPFDYTYTDYKLPHYRAFFSRVREQLLCQRRSQP